MEYIAQRAMTIEVDPTSLTLIRNEEPISRGTATNSLSELMDKLTIRLASPVILQAMAVGPLESMCLIRLGFRLKLPEDIGVRWLRFSSEISCIAEDRNSARSIGIASFSPERITEDIAYEGHIAIDNEGIVHRKPTATRERMPEFPAYGLGFLTLPNRLVWDFFPRNGSLIPGSDNLMLGAKMPNTGEVHFLEAVQMCVVHRQYGEGMFEYSPTTKIVLMDKTS